MRQHIQDWVVAVGRTGACVIATLSGLTGGCASADGHAELDPYERVDDSEGNTSASNSIDEEVDTSSSPLMLWENPNFWPTYLDGVVYIQLCFNGRSDSLESQWLKDALHASWEQVVSIDFTYWNSCPPPAPLHQQYMQVFWKTPPAPDWRMGGSGSNALSPSDIYLSWCQTADCLGASVAEYEEAFKYLVVHEVGHALGFAHEQDRPEFCVPGECGAGDVLTDPDYDSIMLYGRGYWLNSPCPFGDEDPVVAGPQCPLPTRGGYLGADRLSSLDAAGVQEVYPPRLAYWLLPAVLPR